VDLDEVVIGEMQRDRMIVILHFLAEAIRQSGKSPHVHSHGEVLPLHVARRNVSRIDCCE